MKAKGIVLIPYFGKFPKTFDFWMRSAGRVKLLDWLILTDNIIHEELPINIHVRNIGFADVKKLIDAKFRFPHKLDQPWDLCTYRPAYGDLFEEYIAGYDFWGYGDMDVVYGNLDKYLDGDIFAMYDKIFRWGHLSLIRNNEIYRKVYAMKSKTSNLCYMNAFNGEVACFDERLFNDIVEEHSNRGVSDSQPIADFKQRSFLFRFHEPNAREGDRGYIPNEYATPRNVFSWNDSGLYRWYISENGAICSEEFAYIHLCRRDMQICCAASEPGGFCIVPNRFVRMPKEINLDFITSNTRNKIYWSYLLPRLHPKRLLRRIILSHKKIPER